MNRWLRALLSCLALICLTSVQGAPSPLGDKSTTDYYPLAVGNTWKYRVGENSFTLKVTKQEKVGGKDKESGVECARLELIVNGKTTSFEHIAVKGDSLLRYSHEGKSVNPPIPFLKLPPKKGATWDFEAKIDGQPVKGKFVAGEEVVKVPAGSFKTVTVTSQDTEVNGVKISLKYYFAEKVGLVKEVIEFAGERVVIELEKFEAAKS
jgi:hypothetical protein